MYSLVRRGFNLGQISDTYPIANRGATESWANGYPIFLQGICKEAINTNMQAIIRTEKLVLAILEGTECETLLGDVYYSKRLITRFESLGCVINEGDDQEIETLLFDAVEDGATIAEDLWMKISWLSFHEDDASLRFRFSFGIDHVEDVAADTLRQLNAALLAEAIFPESSIISHNHLLLTTLRELLESNEINFVERIIYFNAPNGGAYLHHDLERGHAGVVYAQISGATYWLALPKHALMNEIRDFIDAGVWPESVDQNTRRELVALAQDRHMLARELDSFANNALIQLINETETFVQQLVTNKHGYHLTAGDVLLLPQENQDKCCWHSVFCHGDETGQALSFAIRST